MQPTAFQQVSCAICVCKASVYPRTSLITSLGGLSRFDASCIEVCAGTATCTHLAGAIVTPEAIHCLARQRNRAEVGCGGTGTTGQPAAHPQLCHAAAVGAAGKASLVPRCAAAGVEDA